MRTTEPVFTLVQSASRAGFPSAHALRLYLARHPELAAPRYGIAYPTAPHQRGRWTIRLLTESEIEAIVRDRVKKI